jgi:hypothetical protein
LLPDLVFWPSFLQATPFLIVAALEVVAKEVVARNRPNVATSTDALTLFEALTILNPTFALALDAKNNHYRCSVYPKFK